MSDMGAGDADELLEYPGVWGGSGFRKIIRIKAHASSDVLFCE